MWFNRFLDISSLHKQTAGWSANNASRPACKPHQWICLGRHGSQGITLAQPELKHMSNTRLEAGKVKARLGLMVTWSDAAMPVMGTP